MIHVDSGNGCSHGCNSTHWTLVTGKIIVALLLAAVIEHCITALLYPSDHVSGGEWVTPPLFVLSWNCSATMVAQLHNQSFPTIKTMHLVGSWQPEVPAANFSSLWIFGFKNCTWMGVTWHFFLCIITFLAASQKCSSKGMTDQSAQLLMWDHVTMKAVTFVSGTIALLSAFLNELDKEVKEQLC